VVETFRVPVNASVLSGDYVDRFFDGKNDLKNIRKLKFWPLKNVLVEKYKFELTKAKVGVYSQTWGQKLMMLHLRFCVALLRVLDALVEMGSAQQSHCKGVSGG